MFESALVVLVPEAEELVGELRSRYDSSAAAGMPAHITINYPFLPIGSVESDVLSDLNLLFSAYQRFKFSLEATARFPGVLYFEPHPDRPFTNLIEAVAKRFPESPPYGGVFQKVVPHLTVAEVKDEKSLNDVSQQLSLAGIGKLPIQATVDAVWLMDNKNGKWARRVSFALANEPVILGI